MASGKRLSVTLLVPPQITNIGPIIKQSLQLHKLTKYEEIEPKAGCRRFLLTDGE